MWIVTIVQSLWIVFYPGLFCDKEKEEKYIQGVRICGVWQYLRKALLQGLKPCLFISSKESKEAATVIKMQQGKIKRTIIIALKTTSTHMFNWLDRGKIGRRKREIEDFKVI